MDIIRQPVLVLNANWAIDSIIPARDAVPLLLSDTAYTLVEYAGRAIRSTSMSIPLPAVLVRKFYTRRKRVKLTRKGLFARDAFTCQYCGYRPRDSKGRPDTRQLTWDHVVPRGQSQDGWVTLPWSGARVRLTSWANLLTACIKCNGRKACRTPSQASMPFRREPRKPTEADRGWMELHAHQLQEEWTDYLPKDSPWRDYWSAELDPS